MTEMIIHDDRDTIIAGLREQLRQCREELAAERSKGSTVETGVVNLRRALSPLYSALQQVFGEIGTLVEVGIEADVRPSVMPQKSVAWESWKQRLGGKTAEAIDVLMVHGELNNTQLRIHLGCAARTVQNVVMALNKYQLIKKQNGKISLKDL